MVNKNKLNISLIYAILSSILLPSCLKQSDKQDITDQDIERVTKTKKYVALPDADKILPSWSKENTVVFHWSSEPDDLHPINQNSANGGIINQLLHKYLLGEDMKTLAVKPELVETLPIISKDELSYTYTLREDVKWDDGSPLTVDDVIFTFKAAKCPLTNNPHSKPFLDNIEGVYKEASPRSFTIKMKRKYILNTIVAGIVPIIQKSYFDKKNTLAKYSFEEFDNKKFSEKRYPDLEEWANEFNNPKYGQDINFINGLGAYKITKWGRQQDIVLEKKNNHWTENIYDEEEKSFPQKIIFRVNSDENATMLEVKKQNYDLSIYLSTASLLELIRDKKFRENYHYRFMESYNYSYIAMNMRPDGIKHKKIFTDKKVRKAMAHLTPVDEIIRVIARGKATRMYGPTSPLKEEYNPDLKPVEYNVKLAKKLLEEAGWKDTDGDNIRDKIIDGQKTPLEFTFNYMAGGSLGKDVALILKEYYYKAGINLLLKPMEFAVFYEKAKKHDFDMMMGAWSSSYIPEDYTQLWHTESWASQGSNYTGFGNATTDALIDSIKYTVNDSIRIPLSRKLQAIIADEQPYIFLYAFTRKIIIHKRFGNANMYFDKPGVKVSQLKLLTQ